MVRHRLLRGVLVARADRLEDPAVVLVGALRPARCVERLLPALGQKVHDRVREPRDRTVVRGGADRPVEGGVLDEARPALGDLFRLLFEDPLHLGDLLEGRAARGEGRDAGLEEAARLEELGDRLALRDHHERERLDQRLDRRSEEHTSELQSLTKLVCRLLLEKKNHQTIRGDIYAYKKQAVPTNSYLA